MATVSVAIIDQAESRVSVSRKIAVVSHWMRGFLSRRRVGKLPEQFSSDAYRVTALFRECKGALTPRPDVIERDRGHLHRAVYRSRFSVASFSQTSVFLPPSSRPDPQVDNPLEWRRGWLPTPTRTLLFSYLPFAPLWSSLVPSGPLWSPLVASGSLIRAILSVDSIRLSI